MRLLRSTAIWKSCVGVAVPLGLVGSVPVAAQADPAPSRPVAGVTQGSSHDAEISLARYLDCVVRDDGRRMMALQYLRMDAAAPRAIELREKLSKPDCLGRAIPESITPSASERSNGAGYMGPGSFDIYSLSMPPAAYRNALYPALYRYSFGATGPGAITDKPLLSASAEWDEAPVPLPDVWRVRRAIGDCMARAHPAATHRFVVSTPWSAEETAEMGEVATALAECLPEGQTVRLGREDLRGIVGEALYKLAIAPAAATSAEAN